SPSVSRQIVPRRRRVREYTSPRLREALQLVGWVDMRARSLVALGSTGAALLEEQAPGTQGSERSRSRRMLAARTTVARTPPPRTKDSHREKKDTFALQREQHVHAERCPCLEESEHREA